MISPIRCIIHTTWKNIFDIRLSLGECIYSLWSRCNETNWPEMPKYPNYSGNTWNTLSRIFLLVWNKIQIINGLWTFLVGIQTRLWWLVVFIVKRTILLNDLIITNEKAFKIIIILWSCLNPRFIVQINIICVKICFGLICSSLLLLHYRLINWQLNIDIVYAIMKKYRLYGPSTITVMSVVAI